MCVFGPDLTSRAMTLEGSWTEAREKRDGIKNAESQCCNQEPSFVGIVGPPAPDLLLPRILYRGDGQLKLKVCLFSVCRVQRSVSLVCVSLEVAFLPGPQSRTERCAAMENLLRRRSEREGRRRRDTGLVGTWPKKKKLKKKERVEP